jgi:thiamine-phosphate pyrophosphorylase
MSRMHPLRDRLSLVVVADPAAVPAGRSLTEIVRATLQAGAPAVQLRAKDLTARETVELAHALLDATRSFDALLFVNDRVDIALAVGADGAHVGSDDLPVPAARSIAPPGFLLGRSVDTAEEARVATGEGADYVGVGAVYTTMSKLGLGDPVGPGRIAAVAAATDIPVVGIGGIDADNAAAVVEAGAAGVAVIRSVMAAADPGAAVRAILASVRGASGKG